MSKPNYSTKNFDESCARAYGRNLPISTKTSVEICNFLRGKSYSEVIKILEEVLAFKRAIPYTRFTNGVGHRKGDMASGRYPQKASLEIKQTLESAKSNAVNKGLSDDLRIVHICAHKASCPFHQGRQRRRMMKRTHVEVILKEVEGTKRKEVSKKETKPTTPKQTTSNKQSAESNKQNAANSSQQADNGVDSQ
jgi:large subunit ribosomal protein L22